MEETCEVFTCKNTDPGQLRRSVSEDSEIRQRVRSTSCVYYCASVTKKRGMGTNTLCCKTSVNVYVIIQRMGGGVKSKDPR